MIITYAKFNDWLALLCENHEVIGPTATENVVAYASISDPADMDLNGKPTKSPKNILFPQTQELFTYSVNHGLKVTPPRLDKSKAIIFGVRPCDARSFPVLDLMFDDGDADPYYAQARKRFTLVGFSCTTPWQNCFCTSLDGGPGSTEGLDILITDLGKKYLVEPLSRQGKALVNENPALFSQAAEEDKAAKKEVIDQATAHIKRKIDIADLPHLLGVIFDNGFWKQISDKCLGCGICTYLCPTCHCFDMQDEVIGSGGRRCRMWDSCMFSEYTLHTSGHNPRPARTNRLRNRVLHKFKYYPENIGETLCVGCGRCIDACPANVDIVDIITGVREVAV